MRLPARQIRECSGRRGPAGGHGRPRRPHGRLLIARLAAHHSSDGAHGKWRLGQLRCGRNQWEAAPSTDLEFADAGAAKQCSTLVTFNGHRREDVGTAGSTRRGNRLATPWTGIGRRHDFGEVATGPAAPGAKTGLVTKFSISGCSLLHGVHPDRWQRGRPCWGGPAAPRSAATRGSGPVFRDPPRVDAVARSHVIVTLKPRQPGKSECQAAAFCSTFFRPNCWTRSARC